MLSRKSPPYLLFIEEKDCDWLQTVCPNYTKHDMLCHMVFYITMVTLNILFRVVMSCACKVEAPCGLGSPV